MNGGEPMNDFDYDVLQKKRIAQQAKYRKGTRGKRGCSLPSDNLTAKQLKERNGPLMTVKLDEPMTFESFEALSASLKTEYLKSLREKYSPSPQMVADMLGCSRSSLLRRLDTLKFSLKGNRGMRTQESKDAWDDFCAKGKVEESPTYESKLEENREAPSKQVVLPEKEPKKPLRAKVNSFSANIVGTPEDLLASLQQIMATLGYGVVYGCTLEITAEEME